MQEVNFLALIFVGLGAILCVGASSLLLARGLVARLMTLLFSIALFCGGVFVIVLGARIAEYGYVADSKPIAVVDFERAAPNKITAHIKDHMGNEYRREIFGNFWQLNARVFRWNRAIDLNIDPMVRLERIYTISTETRSTAILERSDQLLYASDKSPDVWRLLKAISLFRKLVSQQESTTTKNEAKIGVTYTVRLSNLGLVVEKRNKAVNLH